MQINTDHCWITDGCKSMQINADQTVSDPAMISIDWHWSTPIFIESNWSLLIRIDWQWFTLGSIPEAWSLLIGIDRHRGLIQHVLRVAWNHAYLFEQHQSSQREEAGSSTATFYLKIQSFQMLCYHRVQCVLHVLLVNSLLVTWKHCRQNKWYSQGNFVVSCLNMDVFKRMICNDVGSSQSYCIRGPPGLFSNNPPSDNYNQK